MPYKPKKWQATNIFIKANKEIDYEKIEAKKEETRKHTQRLADMQKYVDLSQEKIDLLTDVILNEVDEEGVKKSTFGIDITKAKNIGKIMNIITKDMDLGTYGQLILRILLEKRDRSFEQLDSYQLGVYNAISVWALGVLEDKDIFGNKTRQEIIKAFLLQRERDEKRGRDAKRRVEFSDVNEEDYPRISKAFEKVVKK